MSNILIAEDNAVNRDLLQELLEMRGHTPAEACYGEGVSGEPLSFFDFCDVFLDRLLS